MTTGAVYDLGYEPYGGPRRGRAGAWLTLWADGVRRVLGIRRKARRKVMPWILVAMAMIPPIVGVGVAFIIPAGGADAIDLSSQNADFFQISGTLVMLFTALAAPELLIPDRRDGVLSILSSRPMTANDYLSARFASLLTIVGGFLLIPQLILLIGQAGTDPDGLLRGFAHAAGSVPKILVVATFYAIAYVPLGFVAASLSNRKAIASSVYLAGLFALTAIAEAMVQNATFSGSRWFALLAPINTADAANHWIFGTTPGDSLLARADIDPLYGVLALVVIGVGATTFSVLRYRDLL